MTVNKRRIDGASSVASPNRVWPTGTDYSRAIQSPATSFSDPELSAGRPGTNALGMPLVASGQNAVVFLLETGQTRSAVRCFLTPPSEGAYRYAALEDHLVDTAPRALTAARWLTDGIMVGSDHWPVVVMPWVEGTPLNIAVENMLDDPPRLRALATQWVEVVRSLQRAGVAHGDLQHGNLLVRANDSIALVDLDGVWVPEITIGPPAEFGHPNYQHPQRNVQHWGRYVDSFPGSLIELGLIGLAADPALERHLHGENLLFMRADLERPGDSEVWSALCSSPDSNVAQLAALLRQRCAGPIDDVLIPFEDLRTAVVEPSNHTVVRQAANAAPFVEAVPAAAAGEAAWWLQGSIPATSVPMAGASLGASTLPGAPSGGTGPSYSTPPLPQVEGLPVPFKAAAVSPLVQLGRNSMIAGLTGGVLAGVLGSFATMFVDSSLDERGETVAFVAFIGILLGGFLLGMQSIIGRNWGAAVRRFLLGAATGGVAGLLSIPLASAVVLGLATEAPCSTVGPDGKLLACPSAPLEVPFVANILMFMIVAMFIGFALGMLRSVRTAFGGMLAGLLGGAVGGAIFGATVAKYDDRGQLDVLFLKPTTTLVVAIVTGSIGFVYGAMIRARRTASLTIIEGRNSGMEIAVEGKKATIGSWSGCDLVLSGDANVRPIHVTLNLADVPVSLVLAGPISLNGDPVAGLVTLTSGDVLLVGGSFIRVEFKEGQS